MRRDVAYDKGDILGFRERQDFRYITGSDTTERIKREVMVVLKDIRYKRQPSDTCQSSKAEPDGHSSRMVGRESQAHRRCWASKRNVLSPSLLRLHFQIHKDCPSLLTQCVCVAFSILPDCDSVAVTRLRCRLGGEREVASGTQYARGRRRYGTRRGWQLKVSPPWQVVWRTVTQEALMLLVSLADYTVQQCGGEVWTRNTREERTGSII